jgi:hypothetical protein
LRRNKLLDGEVGLLQAIVRLPGQFGPALPPSAPRMVRRSAAVCRRV